MSKIPIRVFIVIINIVINTLIIGNNSADISIGLRLIHF